MFYDAAADLPLPYDPIKALVAPRPIGWISTCSPSGVANLAPYSFFQALSTRPGVLMFSGEDSKDSIALALETGEFVCNLVTWEFREQMLRSADDLPRGTSEFSHAGLVMAPSRCIRAPRVAGAAAALECRVLTSLDLQDLDGRRIGRRAVIGQVVGVHIDDAFLRDGIVDTAAMRLVARCGYRDYTVVDSLFQMDDRQRSLPK